MWVATFHINKLHPIRVKQGIVYPFFLVPENSQNIFGNCYKQTSSMARGSPGPPGGRHKPIKAM